MRTKYKKRAVDYLKNDTERLLSKDKLTLDNINNLFALKDSYLEIGPGKGKFIIDLASRFPNYNFLVIEINKTIAGTCLKNIEDHKLTNVYLICGNYFDYIDILKTIKFKGIFLNFSDPWPKKRHEKRRLTSDDFLKTYINILDDNGYIYFKTDNINFFEYSKKQFKKFRFKTIYESNDYKILGKLDAETEFELKYKEQGIKINRLILKNNVKSLEELNKLWDMQPSIIRRH